MNATTTQALFPSRVKIVTLPPSALVHVAGGQGLGSCTTGGDSGECCRVSECWSTPWNMFGYGLSFLLATIVTVAVTGSLVSQGLDICVLARRAA